ncbi:MAG: nicotinate (nicotinamide) nucleotide adenylyltransferase [Bdellovibrionales bacterium]|nr:nicotinate (nicotinamide) nucleotide adenylyltransferase [Bdellovibrionales bacterium]NQZ18619.1 nicotinate (nicotinamide) nucleotide adenylyltransferase [Bdellovibrionales bacterium]
MNKVALFGGTFDPVHLGHTACVQHLVEKMDFSQVVIIPTSQNPLKKETRPASKEDRLKMIELAVSDFEEEITVDEFEIMQNSPSYSFETLQRYQQQYAPEELYLVMGLDAFEELDQWKNFDKILEMTNILVVSRPPYHRPFGVEDFPKGLQSLVHSYDKGFALLKSGRTVEFVKIKTDDISSSQVRKKLKTGKNINSLINIEVEKYIIDNDVYPRLSPGKVDFTELTHFVGNILKERAMNAAGYDVSELDKLYDFTLVASATSTKQAQSIASMIKDQVKEEYGISPFGIEGKEDGRWVILDYGAMIVHVFYDYIRHEYHLEQLWQDAKRLKL